jgi:hypothetical protein
MTIHLTLMLIAFGIGEHLGIKRLTPVLRTVRLVGMGETLGAYILTAAGCLGVAIWVGAGGGQWRLMNYLVAALLLGAVCVATAPAATLHVLRELKASGALSTILMAVVAVNNGLAMMVFGISVSLVHQLGGDGINLLALVAVLAEIVVSLLLPFGVSEYEVELHTEMLRAWTVRNGLDPIVEFSVIGTQARLETILTAAVDQDLIVIATRSGGGFRD